MLIDRGESQDGAIDVLSHLAPAEVKNLMKWIFSAPKVISDKLRIFFSTSFYGLSLVTKSSSLPSDLFIVARTRAHLGSRTKLNIIITLLI
jgi:hypothetical protein